MRLRPIITFLSVSAVLLTGIFAQEKSTDSPKVEKQTVFTKATAKSKTKTQEQPEIGILVEYISLDHATANRLLGKFTAQAGDVQELRDTLEEMLDAGTADLEETMWVRSRSGQRAKTESVIENQYAMEFDPPEIPNTVGAVGTPAGKEGGGRQGNPEIHRLHSNPVAFETRLVGSTLEIDPVMAKDESLIDLNLAPEIVEKLADQYFTREGMEDLAYGVDHISMPQFYTIKETTQMVVTPGKYNLFGFHTPHDDPTKRIFVILRADLIPFVFGK